MANVENTSIWDKIQRNVQDVERLVGQKKYNLSMSKARQTLEYMVKLQCDKAGIVEGSLENMIRELYETKCITKSTAEHYLQILSIGNKAIKENDNSAYNANQAYHILTQEIYAFANEKEATRRRPASSGSSQRRTSGSNASKSRRRQSRSSLNSRDLLKLLIPVVLVVVLIVLIITLTPKKDPTDETTTAPTTTEAVETEPMPAETTEPETVPETTAVTYRTTDTLNVRSGPSTTNDRIGKLDPGVTVEFVRDNGDGWAVILYNGQEADVSMDYLTSE